MTFFGKKFSFAPMTKWAVMLMMLLQLLLSPYGGINFDSMQDAGVIYADGTGQCEIFTIDPNLPFTVIQGETSGKDGSTGVGKAGDSGKTYNTTKESVSTLKTNIESDGYSVSVTQYIGKNGGELYDLSFDTQDELVIKQGGKVLEGKRGECLVVNKSVDKNSVTLGEALTYTLTFTNNVGITVPVSFTDSLNAGNEQCLTITNITVDTPGAYTPPGSPSFPLTGTVNVQNEQTVVITVDAQVSSTASECTTPITNCLSAGELGNCVDTEFTIPGSPEVTKTAVLDGSVIHYAISGIIPADSLIELTDKMTRPEGPGAVISGSVTIVSALTPTPNPVTADGTSGFVVSFENITTQDEDFSIAFDARAWSGGNYEICNRINLNGTVAGLKVADSDIACVKGYDLEVDKRILNRDSFEGMSYFGSGHTGHINTYPSQLTGEDFGTLTGGYLSPGDWYIYSVVATNNGDGDAYDVHITDTMPEGVEIFWHEPIDPDTSLEIFGGLPNGSGFDWQIERFQVGETRTVDFFVQLSTGDIYGTGEFICNTGVVDAIGEYSAETLQDGTVQPDTHENDEEPSCAEIECKDDSCQGYIYAKDFSYVANSGANSFTISAICVVEGTCGLSDSFAASGTITFGTGVGGLSGTMQIPLPNNGGISGFTYESVLDLTNQLNLVDDEDDFVNYTISDDGVNVTVAWRVGQPYLLCQKETCNPANTLRRTYEMVPGSVRTDLPGMMESRVPTANTAIPFNIDTAPVNNHEETSFACDFCPGGAPCTDIDNDGICDIVDPCIDQDGDGVCDPDDNCIDIPNADQADADNDGIGDVCDNDCVLQLVSVTPNEPTQCGEAGSLLFTTTSLPDGNYTIISDQMTWNNVQFTNNMALVVAAIGSYTNISIESSNGICASAPLTGPFVINDMAGCDDECQVNADCDNGLFCDGDEICNQTTNECDAGTPPVCDNGLFCDGTETCNEGTDSCDAGTPPVCDNGLFCDGTETCNEGTDSCDAGTAPVCDDGLSCSVDSCNETTDICESDVTSCGCFNDGDCDNGQFCDGTETCDLGTNTCISGTTVSCDDAEVCTDDVCNETTDLCENPYDQGNGATCTNVCNTDLDCNNGLFCDGTETCNLTTNTCETGTPPVCDNGLFCDGTETCNEGTDSCDAGTAPVCDDGLSCSVDSCNETTDICESDVTSCGCFNDGDCDNGQFCDGTETCDLGTNTCISGPPVSCDDAEMCTDDSCNEVADVCENQYDQTNDPSCVVDFYDLALRKTVSNTTPGPFSAGDTVTFHITVFNQGTLTASGIQVIDTIPAGLQLLSGQNRTQNGTTATYNNTIGPLAPNGNIILPISFMILPGFVGTLTNHAEIYADDGTDIDSTTEDTQNNQTSDCGPVDNEINDEGESDGTCSVGDDEDDHDSEVITINPSGPDVRINKIVQTSGPYVAGDFVDYTIQVDNLGDGIATNVKLTDTYDQGFTSLSSVTPSVGTYTGVGTMFTRTLGDIAPAGSETITFTLEVGSSVAIGTQLNNIAVATSDEETMPIQHDTNCVLGDNPITDNTLDTLTNNDDCEPITTQEPDPLCGNGVNDPGEECGEPTLSCGAGQTCNNSCRCGGGGGTPDLFCGGVSPKDSTKTASSYSVTYTCSLGGKLDQLDEVEIVCDNGEVVNATEVNSTTYQGTCEFERSGNSTTFEPYCRVFNLDNENVADNRCKAEFTLKKGGGGGNTCGDGVINQGYEQCDDGNKQSGDGCSASCKHEYICGDNHRDPGEECDGGSLCVNCKRIDETIEEVIKRKKDIYKQREIRTVGTTDFRMPEKTPLSGPDEEALNAELQKKGFALLGGKSVDTDSPDRYQNPVGKDDPRYYNVQYWIDQMPKEMRSANQILVIPAIGGATPINDIKNSEVQSKFLKGEVEWDDYKKYLDGGAMHFHGTAGVDEPGVSYIAGHSSSAELPWYKMGADKTDNVFKALMLLQPGDMYYVVDQSADEPEVFTYNVFKTKKVDDTDISSLKQDLHGAGKYMVLSTCGPIGKADWRWEVHAQQIISLEYNFLRARDALPNALKRRIGAYITSQEALEESVRMTKWTAMAHQLRVVQGLLDNRDDIPAYKKERLSRVIEYTMFRLALSVDWPEKEEDIRRLVIDATMSL